MYSVLICSMLTQPTYVERHVVRGNGCQGVQARVQRVHVASGCQGGGYGLFGQRSEPVFAGGVLGFRGPLFNGRFLGRRDVHTTVSHSYAVPVTSAPRAVRSASPDWAASIAGRKLAGGVVSDQEINSVMGWVLENAPNRRD